MHRGNVLVGQWKVPRQEYSVDQVEGYFKQQVAEEIHDHELTDIYQEQKAKRSAS